MKNIFLFLLGFTLLSSIMLSCSNLVDRERFSLNPTKTYRVIPFENYTDTPLAGYRVASLVEGLLRSKGFKVADRVWEYSDRDPSKEELKSILRKATKGADYVIAGTVNEFRYKVGIDGEPAVSVSIYLIDSATGKVVSGATLSGTGMSYESLGTLTHKLIRKLL